MNIYSVYYSIIYKCVCMYEYAYSYNIHRIILRVYIFFLYYKKNEKIPIRIDAKIPTVP